MARLSRGWTFDEDDEDELDRWKAAVAGSTNYDRLHYALIEWSCVLGRLAMNDYHGRALVSRRMDIISDRMHEIKDIVYEEYWSHLQEIYGTISGTET